MKPRCPVCGATFRAQVECSRCGADLAPLMRLIARSQLERERAVDALTRGDWAAAREHAARAARGKVEDWSLRLRDLTNPTSFPPL